MVDLVTVAAAGGAQQPGMPASKGGALARPRSMPKGAAGMANMAGQQPMMSMQQVNTDHLMVQGIPVSISFHPRPHPNSKCGKEANKVIITLLD